MHYKGENKKCATAIGPREDGHPKNKEQGISSANIPKLPGHGTCSANEALTIKRAASSAVGLFPGGVPTTRMSMISICTSNATRAPDRGVKIAKNGKKGRTEGRKEGRKEEECAWDTSRKCVHSAGKRKEFMSIRGRELARLLLECLQNCNRRALQPAENTN